MRCPYCSTLENKVIDSRLSQGGEVTRRRRECEQCRRRYTTYERVEQALPLVLKKDGRRQPFDRKKLLAGLQRACVKRPVTAESLDRLLSRVERSLADGGEQEVPSALVGERVLAELEGLDKVAYVRFASVYRDFQDAEEFLAELRALNAQSRGTSSAEPGLSKSDGPPAPSGESAPSDTSRGARATPSARRQSAGPRAGE